MTIVTLAYAFAPSGPDSVGGAEQIAASLDRAIAGRGYRSVVIAAAASRASGELLPVEVPNGEITPAMRAEVQRQQRSLLSFALQREPVDLVHMHAFDFYALLPEEPVTVLATLHLPLQWYPPDALAPTRPATFLNCVSQSQHQMRPEGSAFLPAIENGVPVDRMMFRQHTGSYALCLGRICEEKGFHFGLQAARKAGVNAVVAGRIFPYAAHEAYFARVLAPELDTRRQYIGAANFEAKRRLLAFARCVLVCSTVPETSSLVAMEALASGTPVIAFRAGALPDIIEHGRTGYIVDSVEAMADAIREAGTIDRSECRRVAEMRFSESRMIRQYLSVYSRIAGHVSQSTGTLV